MCGRDFVAFHRIAQFPSGNYIGDAAVALDAADDDFGDELAGATHEQFAVGNNAFVFAELVAETDMPPGVVNVVGGRGGTTGQRSRETSPPAMRPRAS